jgi:uncharacterized protein (DUF885 family)
MSIRALLVIPTVLAIAGLGCARARSEAAPPTAASAGAMHSANPPLEAGPSVPDLAAIQAAHTSELRDVVARYSRDRDALLRRYDVTGSPDRQTRLRAFYREWKQALDEIAFDDLGLEGRIDWVLLRYSLEARLADLDRQGKRHTEVAPLVPGLDAVLGLLDTRRRRERPDPSKAAEILHTFREDIERTRKALARGHKKKDGSKEKKTERKNEADEPSQRTSLFLAYRATKVVAALRKDLERWNRYYAGYDPEVTWWTKDPYTRLDKELETYGKFLREDILGEKKGEDPPVVGDPVGREALMDQLRAAMIAYTPEELIEIANRELAWCEAELRKAAGDMGFGDDWKAALESIKKKHVAPGEQPRMVRDMAYEAIEYVESRDLITVPALAKEIWRIEMMSPKHQKVNPFFTGGEVIRVSFPTDAMSHEEKLMSMRGNNRPFSRAVVHHEIIPGHHLQGFMTKRHRPHRRAFHTPFWGEGWALHWELLLWDLGFPRTPAERMGMLFWRTHRCARIIFSLRFHLGEMTAEESIDFLVDRVGHERENAEGEVRRSFAGDYSPLYQAAYLTGGLQFRALYRELVSGGKMTARAFHDAVLRGGPIPVELVRGRLLGKAPAKDFDASWRFAD